MSTNPSEVEQLFEKIGTFSKTTIKLLSLQGIDRLAAIVAELVSATVVLIVLLLTTVFINIGIAIWLGEYLGAYYYGFIIVGTGYLLIAIVIYIFRKQFIKIPISELIISKLLKAKQHED